MYTSFPRQMLDWRGPIQVLEEREYRIPYSGCYLHDLIRRAGIGWGKQDVIAHGSIFRPAAWIHTYAQVSKSFLPYAVCDVPGSRKRFLGCLVGNNLNLVLGSQYPNLHRARRNFHF